jgi:hypothetical protein
MAYFSVQILQIRNLFGGFTKQQLNTRRLAQNLAWPDTSYGYSSISQMAVM